MMTYSYYFGFFPTLSLSFPQYLFVCVFILIATFAYISYVSLKINSNFQRIIYILIYIFAWFILGGLISGLVMSILAGIIYVLIREFSGDYS